METIVRKPASFRLRTDLDEPNEVTRNAIKEARNRKQYLKEELYDNAEEIKTTGRALPLPVILILLRS